MYIHSLYKLVLLRTYKMHTYNMHLYRYSCDEGMTWSDFDFMSSRIVVWGIITEPGETTTQVL